MSCKFRMLFLLLLLFLDGVLCLGINNFHFPIGNVLSGKYPITHIAISGTYRMVKTDYPKGMDINITRIIGDGPWVCDNRQLTAQVMGLHMSNTTLAIYENNLNYMISSTPQDLLSLISNGIVKIPFDVTNCTKFSLSPTTKNDDVYTFDLYLKTNHFGPILFVDYLGIGTFNYISSESKVNSQYQNGKVIRFCDNYKYSGYLYSLAPRPICPAYTSRYSKVGYGKITIYKKNIIAYHIPATLCGITKTYVTSYASADHCTKNRPGLTSQAPGDLNQCIGSKHQKKYYANFNPDSPGDLGNLNKYTNDINQRLFCGPTPNRCKDWVSNLTIYDPTKAFSYKGNGTKGPNWFESIKNGASYRYGIPLNWQCMFLRNQRDYYWFANIIPTNVTVIMPDFYGNIPTVGHIGKKDLTNGYFSSNIYGTIIWDPSAVHDLCPYVPRLHANVETITYHGVDIVGGLRDAQTMTYYFNDDLRAAIATTDDMMINGQKFECIKYTSGDKIYKLNTGEIMVFSEFTRKEYVDTVRQKGFVQHHPHSFVNHISAHSQNNKTNNEYKISVVSADDDTGDSSHLNFNDISQPPTLVTEAESIDYIEMQTEAERRRNLQVRTAQHCQMTEQLWDNFNQLLNIDPSVALTQKLNAPIKATHGGNNFYNIKNCELVSIHHVLPSLYTNDTTPIIISPNSTTTIRQIVTNKGIIKPRSDICLTYPIIVFSTRSDPEKRLLGQLSFSGIIDIMKISSFAYCDQSKKYAFTVYNTTYFYTNYVLSSTFDAELSRNDISQSNKHKEDRDMIHLFDIAYHGAKEHVNTYLPSQLVSFDEYTIEEQQSAVISMAELIQEVNKMKYQERLDVHTGEYVSNEDGFFGSLGEIGDVLTGITSDIGDTISDVLSAGASSLGGSIMSILKSIITPLIIGLITVIVIFVIGQLIYKKVLMNNSSSSSRRSEEQLSQEDNNKL